MAIRSVLPYKLNSAASTNATSVKAASARLMGYDIVNSNAAARYVKLYDKASAPTVGTDTPKLVIGLPPASRASLSLTESALFPTGLALAITTGAADSDTVAVGANDVVLNLFYE